MRQIGARFIKKAIPYFALISSFNKILFLSPLDQYF